MVRGGIAAGSLLRANSSLAGVDRIVGIGERGQRFGIERAEILRTRAAASDEQKQGRTGPSAIRCHDYVPYPIN